MTVRRSRAKVQRSDPADLTKPLTEPAESAQPVDAVEPEDFDLFDREVAALRMELQAQAKADPELFAQLLRRLLVDDGNEGGNDGGSDFANMDVEADLAAGLTGQRRTLH